MNTGTFETEELILEVTRPDSLEGTTLRRFTPEQLTHAESAYRRAMADPEISRVGLYRQRSKISRWEIAVDG